MKSENSNLLTLNTQVALEYRKKHKLTFSYKVSSKDVGSLILYNTKESYENQQIQQKLGKKRDEGTPFIYKRSDFSVEMLKDDLGKISAEKYFIYNFSERYVLNNLILLLKRLTPTTYRKIIKLLAMPFCYNATVQSTIDPLIAYMNKIFKKKKFGKANLLQKYILNYLIITFLDYLKKET